MGLGSSGLPTSETPLLTNHYLDLSQTYVWLCGVWESLPEPVVCASPDADG